MAERSKWTDGRLDDRFGQMDKRFDRLEAHMDSRFAEVNAEIGSRFNELSTRLDSLNRTIIGAVVSVAVALILKGLLGG